MGNYYDVINTIQYGSKSKLKTKSVGSDYDVGRASVVPVVLTGPKNQTHNCI